MRKQIIVAFLILSLLLPACGPKAPIQPETTAPPTTAPAEPTTPTVSPTTAPELSWLVEAPEPLRYENYFGRTDRNFSIISSSSDSWFNREKGQEYCYRLSCDAGGLFVCQSTTHPIYRIPDSEGLIDCIWTHVDGKWAYGIRNGLEIIRLELVTGNVASLFIGDQIVLAPGLYLCDREVLYFTAVKDGFFGLYRMYLPDLTLDLIKDFPQPFPDSWFSYFVNGPSTVTFFMMNPDFFPLLQEVLTNPNSSYWQDEMFTDSPENEMRLKSMDIDNPDDEDFALRRLAFLIQEDNQVSARVKCSFDFATGGLYQENAPIVGMSGR